jgi:hypothetical protein
VVVPSVSQIAVWLKYIQQHFDKDNNQNNNNPRIALLYGGMFILVLVPEGHPVHHLVWHKRRD